MVAPHHIRVLSDLDESIVLMIQPAAKRESGGAWGIRFQFPPRQVAHTQRDKFFCG